VNFIWAGFDPLSWMLLWNTQVYNTQKTIDCFQF